MKHLSRIAALLLPLFLSVPAQAQTVYRCGNSYSQQPCPGGSSLDASDSRSSEQRKAHEASVQHEKRTADSLEKNRLKEEAAAARAAEQADKAQRAADSKATKKPATTTAKNQRAKDRLPAYNAPATPKKK
jgi:hypothetical protein